jgi:hypothetical protein
MVIFVPEEALAVDVKHKTKHNAEHNTTAKITDANCFFTLLLHPYLLPLLLYKMLRTLRIFTLAELRLKDALAACYASRCSDFFMLAQQSLKLWPPVYYVPRYRKVTDVLLAV